MNGRVDDRFEVRQRRYGEDAVVAVCGSVDMITAPQLASQLEMAAASNPPVLVIDLTDVTFLSSAGIQVLVEVQRLSASIGTCVRVVGRDYPTVHPIHVLGLERTLRLYPTVQEAVSQRPSATEDFPIR